MTINFNTLFADIGAALQTAEYLVSAYVTDVEPAVRAFQDGLDDETQAIQYAINTGIETGLDTLDSALGSALTALVGTPVQNLIIEKVNADVPLRSKSISAALTILIDQMEDNAESVDASTLTTTITYGEGGSSSGWAGDNYGTGVIVVCTKRGDGRVNEFALSETIRCEITASQSSGEATWKLTGEPSDSLTSPEWPGGSSISKTITSYVGTSSANLVPNGDFADEDTNADYLPDDWILSVGTLNSTIRVTTVEQQTVTINGTPTGGHYTLSFTDRDLRVYTTVPLAYNASGSAVQTALQALPWLGSVTVATTGTSPDYTHTITMYGVPSPSSLTYTSLLTGGTPTITVATPTSGSGGVMRGDRTLEFDGDGADLTAIQCEVTLSRATCYCANLWMNLDVTPAAGTLVCDLVDGIAGTTLTDDQGNSNTFTVDLTAVGTYPESHYGCFHTPSVMPPLVYFRIRLTTALSAGTSLFIDEACLVPMTEMYAGGPYISAFTGRDDFEIGDEATITIVNNREGRLHEWLNRLLNLSGSRLMLPTAVAGTQPDTLIT
jgi:hypothetical protein